HPAHNWQFFEELFDGLILRETVCRYEDHPAASQTCCRLREYSAPAISILVKVRVAYDDHIHQGRRSELRGVGTNHLDARFVAAAPESASAGWFVPLEFQAAAPARNKPPRRPPHQSARSAADRAAKSTGYPARFRPCPRQQATTSPHLPEYAWHRRCPSEYAG